MIFKHDGSEWGSWRRLFGECGEEIRGKNLNWQLLWVETRKEKDMRVGTVDRLQRFKCGQMSFKLHCLLLLKMIKLQVVEFVDQESWTNKLMCLIFFSLNNRAMHSTTQLQLILLNTVICTYCHHLLIFFHHWTLCWGEDRVCFLPSLPHRL